MFVLRDSGEDILHPQIIHLIKINVSPGTHLLRGLLYTLAVFARYGLSIYISLKIVEKLI